jgi:hypothetical protein
MAKTMTLSKRWFTREEAEQYGTVDDPQDEENWTVTFPDDPEPLGHDEGDIG